MTKKLLTLMMVLCLSVTSVMIPSHAIDAEVTDNPEYDNLTGLSLKGEEEQKEEETGENEFTFSDAIALGTHVFDYVDRKQFEESCHVARLEPLEELNTYVFANEDGTQTMYMMAENVKFVAEDGNIREKNIKLIKIEDHYETEDNNVSVFIPDDYSEGVKISFGEDYIFMKAEGENSEAITDEKNNTVTYKNIFGEEIDVRYTPTLSGLKEDIILNSYTGINEFSFIIRTSLCAFEDEAGIYFARERNSETRFDLGRIFIYDAAGNFDIGNIILEETEEGYKVTVTANKEFLEAESTVYPISVDPTITIENRDANGNYLIQDVPIYEYHPNYNFREDIEDVCGWKYDTHGIGRTAIRLVGLEQNTVFNSLSYSDITSMYLNIRSTTDAAAKNIYINKMLGEQTWNRNTVTWNNVGTYDGSGMCTGSLAYWQWSAVNITTIAQMWRAYDYDSLCLLCRFGGNESSDHVSFYSSEHSSTNVKPYLSLTYRGQITLDKSVVYIQENGSAVIHATLDNSTMSVSWNVNNSSIASISASGNTVTVSGLKAGTTYVTAYVASNNQVPVQICGVVVSKPDGVYTVKNTNSNYMMTKPSELTGTHYVFQYGSYAPEVSEITKLTQKWKITNIGNGYCTVRPMHNLAMALYNDNGIAVVKNIGSSVPDNAKWRINWDNGYILYSNAANKSLQITEPSLALGENIVIGNYTNNTSAKSKWVLDAQTNVSSGIFFYDTTTGFETSGIERYIAPEEELTLDDFEIAAIVYSPSTSSQAVVWTSSNDNIAVVSSNGTVTGVSQENATISASATIGGITYSVSYTLHVTAIPNGTYFVQNQGTYSLPGTNHNVYMQVKYNSLTNDQEVVQHKFDETVQKWTITRESKDYYSIKRADTTGNYYLSVLNNSSSSNASAVINTSFANKSKWKIDKTNSGSYKILPKAGEANGYVLKTTTDYPDNDYGLVQGTYQAYRGEWNLIYINTSFVNMYIGDNPGDSDMPGIDQSVRNEFQSNSLKGNSYFKCSKNELNHILKNTKIFSCITHGEQDGIKMSDGNYYTISDLQQITDSDLDDLEFVYYGACYTGQGRDAEVNLVNSTYNKGVDFVLGFTEQILVDEAECWSETFMKEIAKGMTVQAAFDAADEAVDGNEDLDGEVHKTGPYYRYYCGSNQYQISFD